MEIKNYYKNKIVVSGCSYSAGAWPFALKENHLLNVDSMAISGQSNQSITRKIYDYITNNNCKNTLFICQLTWLHRIGCYHDIINEWLDYQPNFINFIPKYNEVVDKLEMKYHEDNVRVNKSIKINKDEYNELENMYKTYLKFVYNEDESFINLLYKIDLLESFVEKTQNEILFIYWPLINNELHIKQFQNRNFFNINGEYSMLNWSTKNKKLNNIDSHLSNYGHTHFAGILNKYLKTEELNLEII
jgi:hypothetical protein